MKGNMNGLRSNFVAFVALQEIQGWLHINLEVLLLKLHTKGSPRGKNFCYCSYRSLAFRAALIPCIFWSRNSERFCFTIFTLFSNLTPTIVPFPSNLLSMGVVPRWLKIKRARASDLNLPRSHLLLFVYLFSRFQYFAFQNQFRFPFFVEIRRGDT